MPASVFRISAHGPVDFIPISVHTSSIQGHDDASSNAIWSRPILSEVIDVTDVRAPSVPEMAVSQAARAARQVCNRTVAGVMFAASIPSGEAHSFSFIATGIKDASLQRIMVGIFAFSMLLAVLGYYE